MSGQSASHQTHHPAVDRRSLDPRLILLAFISLTVWITYSSDWTTGLAGVGAAMVLALIRGFGRLSVLRLLRILRWAVPFGLLVFVFYSLLSLGGSGQLVRVGPLSVTREAMDTGGRLALRLVAFVVLAQALMWYTTPGALAAGLTRLLLPMRRLGLKPALLHHFMFMTFRLLPALVAESRTIRLGQRSRGWRPGRRWLAGIRSAPAIVVPVFAAAMRRADALATVMISRGFDPETIPASVLRLNLDRRDYALLVTIMVAWLTWIWMRFL